MTQDERIRIGFEEFSVAISPAAGGKIASIRMDECELLQQPLTGDLTRSRTMPFEASDASGWDECLPSVSPCEQTTATGVAMIPDHGDLWRVPWDVLHLTPTACTMRARCFSLPLELTRAAAVERIDAGFRIRFDYTLCNIGASPAPWAWAAHPLFAVQPGDRILLPESIHAVRVEWSGRGRWKNAGVNWPRATTSAGMDADLSVVQQPDSAVADKLFAGPLSASANWCALERSSASLRIRLSFDPAATPFLGLWLCYGGWPATPGPKQVCVALEPSTSPADSLADAGSWQRMLDSGASCSWTMAVEFQRI